MDEDKLPWQEKLVAPMTDGCNTMAGCNAGVKKKLEERVPQLKDVGSCNAHQISNAGKYGVEAFDNDVKEVLVNVYFDIGGAKGKGLKKRKNYQAIAKAKHRKLKALKKFCLTRFQSFRTCISPILFNWDMLIDYYSSLSKPTSRQTKLKGFFVDQEFASMLKFEFVMAAAKDINDAISFFEERSNKIHLAREKMEMVLRTQLRRFLKQGTVHNVDDDGDLVKKTGPELLSVDVNDKSGYLGRKSVFVGQKCASLMKDVWLTPQVDFFYDKVYNFHKTMASKMQIYFEKGLNSTELEYMAAFSPDRTKECTCKQILYLARSYSKIVNGISPT